MAAKKGPKPRPLAERFAEKVNRNGPAPAHKPELGPCHLWTGAINARTGYGAISIERSRTRDAHRVAFFLEHGRWPQPEGMHRCDVRACVKARSDEHGPAHVVEGSHLENMRDAVAKGRTARGARLPHAKLTAAAIPAIRAALAAGELQRDVAERHGVHLATISDIARGITWRHVPEILPST